MNSALNYVDLCFVIDTTGSMGQFISTAQQHLLNAISVLSANNGIDLKMALVQYRDHPPQDNSFVTRVSPLTADLKEMQQRINGLKADGGGDAPEAVYDGLQAACAELQWRAHSCRFVMLVGDAPPHGFKYQAPETSGRRATHHENYGDTWPDGCPCGITAHAIASMAERKAITVHALAMGNSPVTYQSFAEVAVGTGGLCAAASDSKQILGKIGEMLANEFRDLKFDHSVLTTVRKLVDLDINELANRIGCTQIQAAAAIARLGRRGFIS